MDHNWVEDTGGVQGCPGGAPGYGAGWLFRQWGKVRDLNWDAVGHMSQREMLLLAWIKSMLEALESGE